MKDSMQFADSTERSKMCSFISMLASLWMNYEHIDNIHVIRNLAECINPNSWYRDLASTFSRITNVTIRNVYFPVEPRERDYILFTYILDYFPEMYKYHKHFRDRHILFLTSNRDGTYTARYNNDIVGTFEANDMDSANRFLQSTAYTAGVARRDVLIIPVHRAVDSLPFTALDVYHNRELKTC